MKNTTKIILIGVIVLLLGLSSVCVGLIADPFSLPFQDFSQMPLEDQIAYQARSEAMRIVRLAGGCVSVIAILTLMAAFIAKMRQKVI